MAGPTRVLYVATDPASLDRVHGVHGTRVTSTTEGTAAAALERVDGGTVDCVVSEYDLPDATGVELLGAVRRHHPTLPFVLFSETPLRTVARVAVESDRSGYLKRDPDCDQRAELTATVEDAVDAVDEGQVDPRERFRTIIEQSSDVVSVLDGDGVYRYQSPSVRRVLGYDPGAFIGRRVFEFVHPDDRREVRIDFFSAVDDPERTITVEYRFEHADGSWRVVESQGTNMLADPVVEGFVVNTRDVTDRHRREQRMSVLNRALRHDLRNNMNIVLGNTELLMREHGPDDRAETIRRTAADMLELGDKVRDVERALDASETPREPVDVVSVVEKRLTTVRRTRPEVAVETDLPGNEWVLANRYVGSAIDDAIENAVEHNDTESPRLRVTLSDDELTGDDAARLTVADDGPGIPQEELAVLEGGGETPLRHSSGLGLWLITWIVTESAGTVTFRESDLGGTAVDITLKRVRASQRIDLD